MPNSAHLRVYGPLPLPRAPLERRLTLLLITVARPNTLTVEHLVNSMEVAAFLCSCVSAVSVHTVYPNSPLVSCVWRNHHPESFGCMEKHRSMTPVGVKPAMLRP
jgi:hypothetical protein